MTPVIVNTAFECIGAVLAGRSAFLASRVRPQGVSWLMMAFSGLWAVECTFYYLSHGETVAACAAVLRCGALGAWCVLASRKI